MQHLQDYREYPAILEHPDVEVFAEQVVEAGHFLQQLHASGQLKTDFKPLSATVGYHLPCHLKALNSESPLSELLTLIPDLAVNRIEKGCSGMAGAFGLTRENFDTSIQIGRELISRMRSDDITAGVTECSSCRLQMVQGTAIPTLHPLKLFAMAYGLMPDLQQRLKRTSPGLIV